MLRDGIRHDNLEGFAKRGKQLLVYPLRVRKGSRREKLFSRRPFVISTTLLGEEKSSAGFVRCQLSGSPYKIPRRTEHSSE